MENIALFIDGDNVCKQTFQWVFDEIKIRGRICIKRIYFDFHLKLDPLWKQILLSNGIESISVLNIPSKNSTDIKLMLDMIKEYYMNAIIDTYIIMSSDSDFYHIATFLRSNGKKVICYGESHTPPLLKNVCDEFILCSSFKDHEKDTKEEDLYQQMILVHPYVIPVSQITRSHSAWKEYPYYILYNKHVYIVRDIYQTIRIISLHKNLEKKNLSVLKDYLKLSDPSFQERNWQFNSFKKFVMILLPNLVQTSFHPTKKITQIDKIIL